METITTPHDQPLPHSLATRIAGWGSVARQYPIFGKTWFGYRVRSFLVPLGLLTAVMVLIGAFIPGSQAALVRGALLAVWLVVVLALFLGRGLAVMVCRQRWPAQREVAGVVCALLLGALVALTLTPYTRINPPPPPIPHATPEQAEQLRARTRETHVVNVIFWVLVLGWLGGGTDLLAWLRQRRLMRENELLGEVARYRDERNEVEMQLSILASQVEPHFLFNTLSGVRAAMLSDPARGVAMIDHLVDYLRATIPQLRADRAQTFVSLGSQLDAAQAYLGIIRARLPRLDVAIDCPPELRKVAIPPLMLISLVENAVKHGIELKKGPARIAVSAMRRQADDGALLELAVADDGLGFGGATSGSGIGLSNIRERLKHLYGDAAALSLRANDGGGVTAAIVLPLRAMPDKGA